MSSFSIINNCLEREILLQFCAMIFSLVRRIFSNKKPTFFNFQYFLTVLLYRLQYFLQVIFG